MKIYTKTGDRGTTALIGGKRVAKDHVRIEAYGTADELISFLALLRDSDIAPVHKSFILSVQEDLMVISSILAADCGDCTEKLPKLATSEERKLETEIDRLEQELEPLKAFIIPGGDICVSVCHVARTVCRRLERVVLSLHASSKVPGEVLRYINRLSDYLFTLARSVAAEKQVDEIIWKPKLD
ncbi:MAG: cob(I)yrinic acid a,c-diamide adenosyltransferase [Bacteroidales bacterium]|nr:cob(I)yrinic acid a,c-diamide adenosyltransferase [Bacteroidales bacterium]